MSQEEKIERPGYWERLSNRHLKHCTPEKATHFMYLCPGCGFYHCLPIRGKATEETVTWTFDGNGEKPTFAPSVLYAEVKHRCHHYVTLGRIQFLNDCAHDLKGQTVDLPPPITRPDEIES